MAVVIFACFWCLYILHRKMLYWLQVGKTVLHTFYQKWHDVTRCQRKQQKIYIFQQTTNSANSWIFITCRIFENHDPSLFWTIKIKTLRVWTNLNQHINLNPTQLNWSFCNWNDSSYDEIHRKRVVQMFVPLSTGVLKFILEELFSIVYSRSLFSSFCDISCWPKGLSSQCTFAAIKTGH